MKRYSYEGIVEAIRRRQRSLEVMQKLLKLKLIRNRADLTLLVIYYRVCNAVLRAVVKTAAHSHLEFAT